MAKGNLGLKTSTDGRVHMASLNVRQQVEEFRNRICGTFLVAIIF